MGEVYRARDTKLVRDVALKLLPDEFSRDADRMARFTREAQMLAALNHNNIAAIYGIEESGSRRALVLELVDGETLAQRIARGPMPILEVVKLSLQLTEALEAAHEKGIVHRDLKPANIKITPQGVVKVLDFGLALALQDQSAQTVNMSQYPTLRGDETNPGMIIGSAGYMSPEQARGKPSDRRADIWSFGAVLFEMLAGRQPFAGETISDSLAKILEREPDWQQLPATTPAALRKLLKSCLKKNVRDRLQSIGDARNTLLELLSNPAALESGAEAETSRWKAVLPWLLLPLIFAAGWLLKPAPATITTPQRFEVALPPGTNMAHFYRSGVQVSPDGKRLAFVAKAGLGTAPEDQAKSQIYLRSVDQWDAVPVPGSEGAINAIFSPDSQWLAFVSRSAQRSQIMKVSLSGGSPIPVTEVNTIFGMSWDKAGTIIFADQTNGALKAVPDSGGTAVSFTELNAAANEVSHRLPYVLPDGSVLFTVLRYKYVTPDWSKAQIWVRNAKTGNRTLLIENGTDAKYSGNGRLLFARLGKIWAVGFDPGTLTVSGQPVQVIDNVTHATYEQGTNSTTGAAQYSVSASGTLLYAPGGIEPPIPYSLVWADRKGNTTPVGTDPMSHLSVRLSPNGKDVLFNEYYVQADLWIYDTTRGVKSRETFEGQNAFPVWAPDGSAIAFRSDRSGPSAIYYKKLNGQAITQLTSGPNDTPNVFTPDGKELAFVRARPVGTDTVSNIFILPLDKPDAVRPLQVSQFDETHPEFSPNGKWLAFDSNESGRREVYVQGYPEPGDRVQVSTDGGTEPAWSRDGKELFYLNRTRMMSVRFRADGNTFVPERPVFLFDGVTPRTNARAYDVTNDGRFLFPKARTEQAEDRLRKIFPSSLRIVLHWTDELLRVGK